MKIAVHSGVVFVYRINSGWYTHIRAFPEAIKKVSKDEYVPDCNHASVLKYVKDIL